MRITFTRRNFCGLRHFEKGEKMNALLKKEIRLLLPSFLVVLLLEAVQPWFWTDADVTFIFAPVILFFGIIILAVGSFGREFGLGTFQSLLSQPIERRQLWRTKITALIFATALIFIAYFASCEMRLHLALADINSIWHINPTIIGSDFRNAMFGSGAVMLVALAGGLWTTLLLLANRRRILDHVSGSCRTVDADCIFCSLQVFH